jgi:hypothetical protein
MTGATASQPESRVVKLGRGRLAAELAEPANNNVISRARVWQDGVQLPRSKREHTYYSNSPGKPGKAKRPPRAHTPNHRDRGRQFLRDDQLLDLISAATHARIIGSPLNRFLTIILREDPDGNVNGRAQKAISEYLDHARRWLKRRHVEAAFVWTIEMGSVKGLHAHILLHCPDEHYADFSKLAHHRWPGLAGIETSTAGLRLDPGDRIIKFSRWFDKPPIGGWGQGVYLKRLGTQLKYMTKAIDPEARATLIVGPAEPWFVGFVATLAGTSPARFLVTDAADMPTMASVLGIHRQPCPVIYGRRCSRSQNISEKSRRLYAEERAQRRLGGPYSAICAPPVVKVPKSQQQAPWGFAENISGAELKTGAHSSGLGWQERSITLLRNEAYQLLRWDFLFLCNPMKASKSAMPGPFFCEVGRLLESGGSIWLDARFDVGVNCGGELQSAFAIVVWQPLLIKCDVIEPARDCDQMLGVDLIVEGAEVCHHLCE